MMVDINKIVTYDGFSALTACNMIFIDLTRSVAYNTGFIALTQIKMKVVITRIQQRN